MEDEDEVQFTWSSISFKVEMWQRIAPESSIFVSPSTLRVCICACLTVKKNGPLSKSPAFLYIQSFTPFKLKRGVLSKPCPTLLRELGSKSS